ncbi:MAG: helix-turn-helix domain-containing protein [Gaiellaceae bacterium]
MEDRPDRRLLGPDEVAALCGLSRKAVYRAIERGELQASKLCSRLRIRPDDVERWIEANRLEKAATSKRRPVRVPASTGLRILLRDAGSGMTT